MDGKHVSMLALRGQYGLSSIALAVTVVTSRFVLKNALKLSKPEIDS